RSTEGVAILDALTRVLTPSEEVALGVEAARSAIANRVNERPETALADTRIEVTAAPSQAAISLEIPVELLVCVSCRREIVSGSCPSCGGVPIAVTLRADRLARAPQLVQRSAMAT